MSKTRRPRRFFSENIPEVGAMIQLSSSETKHLKTILRLGPGDHCLLVDGSGREASAQICNFTGTGQATLKIEEIQKKSNSAYKTSLRACQALMRKGKIDFLIEKAQELGVNAFWPIQAERSQVKLTPDVLNKVVARWQKKTQEAAKQSGSSRLMEIGPVKTLQETLNSLDPHERIAVFHPDSQGVCFKDWIWKLCDAANQNLSLNLFFGPEGGFSEKEITEIKKHASDRALEFVSLGGNILRLETAFLGVMTAVRLLLP